MLVSGDSIRGGGGPKKDAAPGGSLSKYYLDQGQGFNYGLW